MRTSPRVPTGFTSAREPMGVNDVEDAGARGAFHMVGVGLAAALDGGLAGGGRGGLAGGGG